MSVASEVYTRVQLILGQATPVSFARGNRGVSLNLATDDFDAASVVCEKDEFDVESEQLDLLKVVFSTLSDDMKPLFWDAVRTSMTAKSASVVANLFVDCRALSEIWPPERQELYDDSEIPKWILLWHGLRSRLSFQPGVFTDEDLDRLVHHGRLLLDVVESAIPGWERRRGIDRELTAIARTIARVKYLRLRHLLVHSENPELNTDRKELIARGTALHFSPDIAQALDEIDRRIRSAGTPFDFKSCMDLCRTVFEQIVQQSSAAVESRTGKPVPSEPRSNFNPYKQYLQNAGIINADEAEVLQKFYNYVSNAGAHALGSQPEQVRVTKNTVIEWSLMLVGRVQALPEHQP